MSKGSRNILPIWVRVVLPVHSPPVRPLGVKERYAHCRFVLESRQKKYFSNQEICRHKLDHNQYPMQDTFSLVDHPLVQHKLTLMRDKNCPTAHFRQLIREIALLLAYEVTRDLPLAQTEVETPLETMQAPILAGKKLCFISVLRAGNGLLEGMLDLIPSARVGHIGLYRDPDTLQAVEYYYKVPEDISERQAIVVDPMLATATP